MDWIAHALVGTVIYLALPKPYGLWLVAILAVGKETADYLDYGVFSIVDYCAGMIGPLLLERKDKL